MTLDLEGNFVLSKPLTESHRTCSPVTNKLLSTVVALTTSCFQAQYALPRFNYGNRHVTKAVQWRQQPSFILHYSDLIERHSSAQVAGFHCLIVRQVISIEPESSRTFRRAAAKGAANYSIHEFFLRNRIEQRAI
jgi:hypothetical protein